MKYLSLYTPVKQTTGGPACNENMTEMGKLIEDSMKAGTLVWTGGLLPISNGGARVRLSGGEATVMDGPFSETKEVVGGIAILEAKSTQEAIELTKRFLKVAGGGECELRQIMAPEMDFASR